MPLPTPSNILTEKKGKLYDVQRDRVENEPQPVRQIFPKCPKHFTKEQKQHWNYFRRILQNYGLFNVANAAHLELLAVNMAGWREAQERIAESGMVIERGKGKFKFNPYFSAAKQLEGQIFKSLAELGLSSIGLAKIGGIIAKKKKEEGIGRFLD